MMKTLVTTLSTMRIRFKKYAFFLLIPASVLLYSCTNSTQSGTVGVNRKQIMLLPANAIEKASATAYEEMLKEAAAKGLLNNNKAIYKRVTTIAQNLIPQVTVFRQDAATWKWEVNVFDSQEINAFCMAGGKIGFYTGLINALKASDDEIAAVMGHEIAHALREHSREQATTQIISQYGLAALSQFAGLENNHINLAQQITAVTFTLPNSRSHESEADKVGIELAARGGYDPYAAVSLWKKMEQTAGKGPPEFLSTHPSPQTRQQDLAELAKKVYPLYTESKKNKKQSSRLSS